MTLRTSLAVVAAVSLSAAVAISAQGRPGGPGPGANRPRTGTVERVAVPGRSLEGNLEGDPTERAATVYLPPSYADQARRFPVLYLLHGYGGREDTFTQRLAKLQESGDRLSAAQGFSDVIVVTPDAFTLHKGSMYSSSPTIGDWERFVAEDLVTFMDGRYRTLPDRMSRGLAGHSMGGYGALRIGMKRPDVFFSLYVMSACCLAADPNPNPQTMAAAEAIKTREQAMEAAQQTGFTPSVMLAQAAAWSPNPKNAPLFFDLPIRNGKLLPDVLARWAENAPIQMLEKHGQALQQYYAIAIDIGTEDSLLDANRQLHAALTRMRIPHAYEEYAGDHTNKVGERIDRHVLPFFSKNLVAPANPTSPRPNSK